MPPEPAPLDDGDRALLRACPFSQFIPKHPSRMVAARLKRIRSLTVRGLLHGKPEVASDGINSRVTLTRAGRIALGLNPDPPV